MLVDTAGRNTFVQAGGQMREQLCQLLAGFAGAALRDGYAWLLRVVDFLFGVAAAMVRMVMFEHGIVI